MRRKGEKRETPGSGEESAIIDFNQWEGKEKRERETQALLKGEIRPVFPARGLLVHCSSTEKWAAMENWWKKISLKLENVFVRIYYTYPWYKKCSK